MACRVAVANTAMLPNPPSPIAARRLSDFLYDAAPNNLDDVVDRLAMVVQVLVQRQPREVQVHVLDILNVRHPNLNQSDLFA